MSRSRRPYRNPLRCDATNPFYSENLKRYLAGKEQEKARAKSAKDVKAMPHGAEHLDELRGGTA